MKFIKWIEYLLFQLWFHMTLMYFALSHSCSLYFFITVLFACYNCGLYFLLLYFVHFYYFILYFIIILCTFLLLQFVRFYYYTLCFFIIAFCTFLSLYSVVLHFFMIRYSISVPCGTSIPVFMVISHMSCDVCIFTI